MMLNREKFVTRPALHSLMSWIIEVMLVVLEVNGAEMEASAGDKDSPISACFNAPQSFAPSPHIDTVLPQFWYKVIILVLSFGFVLANTLVFERSFL